MWIKDEILYAFEKYFESLKLDEFLIDLKDADSLCYLKDEGKM